MADVNLKDVYKSFGKRIMVIYLAVVAVMSILFGLAFDWVLPQAGQVMQMQHVAPHLLSVVAAGALVVVLMVLAAALAHWIAPYDPTATDFSAMAVGPDAAHWLGTDQFGRDLLSRIERVERLGESIERRAGDVREAVLARLRKRTEQLSQETGLYDEARLHQEIVLAADRLDITEELVRLRSHIAQFREIVAGAAVGNPVGRRLDFLIQEFAREANTIGSKGSDAPIAHEVVELKAELERIREQVQNVE